MLRGRLIAAFAAALIATAAHAAVPPAAQSAYNAGEFYKAATLAEMMPDAEALAFGARARIADAIVREGPYCIPCLIVAETVAEHAIAADPNRADAYVQLALAMGLRGRLEDLEAAEEEHLASKGRIAIDKALALEPKNPLALAALGAWHLEIVRRAGPILADATYGATKSDGLKSFGEALALAPSNLVLHFHFALQILSLDVDGFRERASQALEAGFKDPNPDALTSFTRKRAQTLRDTLKAGSEAEVTRLVRRYEGFPE